MHRTDIHTYTLLFFLCCSIIDCMGVRVSRHMKFVAPAPTPFGQLSRGLVWPSVNSHYDAHSATHTDSHTHIRIKCMLSRATNSLQHCCPLFLFFHTLAMPLFRSWSLTNANATNAKNWLPKRMPLIGPPLSCLLFDCLPHPIALTHFARSPSFAVTSIRTVLRFDHSICAYFIALFAFNL